MAAFESAVSVPWQSVFIVLVITIAISIILVEKVGSDWALVLWIALLTVVVPISLSALVLVGHESLVTLLWPSVFITCANWSLVEDESVFVDRRVWVHIIVAWPFYLLVWLMSLGSGSSEPLSGDGGDSELEEEEDDSWRYGNSPTFGQGM